MLALEAAALLLLRATVRNRIRNRRLLDDAVSPLVFAVIAVRGSARLAGVQTAASSVGLPLPLVGAKAEADAARAARVASGWRKAAQVALDKTNDVAQAVIAGDSKLRVASASEVSQVFNEERARSAEEDQRRTGETLYKAWDAVNDKRTCPVCERNHGTIVRVDESFPEGEPGGVHPNCRCNTAILTAAEAGFGWAA